MDVDVVEAIGALAALGWEPIGFASFWCRGTEMSLAFHRGRWITVTPLLDRVEQAPEPYYVHEGVAAAVVFRGGDGPVEQATHFSVFDDEDELLEAAPMSSLPAFVEWWRLGVEAGGQDDG